MTNQPTNAASANNSTAMHDENEVIKNHVTCQLKVADELTDALDKFDYLNQNYPAKELFKDIMLSLSESEAWEESNTRIRHVEFIEEMREICDQLSLISHHLAQSSILIVKSGQSQLATQMEANTIINNWRFNY